MSSTAHASTELVANGNFEAGDVSGWTESGNLAGGFVFPVVSDPVNPSNILGIFASETPYFISQTLATHTGGKYTFSFDVQIQGIATTPGSVTFDAFFGGQQVVGLVDQNLEWTHFSFTNLVATGNQTVLRLGGRNDPDFTRLDNVSVIATAVPEPETAAMMLAGLAALGFATRRRKLV
jgi:hypothetical protein